MKLTDLQVKMVVWAIAFIAVSTLIALGKVPASSLGYFLSWAAGTVGGVLKPSGDSSASGGSDGQPGQ